MPDLIKLVRCRLCNGDFSSEVLQLKPTPPANTLYKSQEDAISAKKFPLNVRMCSRCKHFQLTEIVNPKLLFDDYVYIINNFRDKINYIKYEDVLNNNKYLKKNIEIIKEVIKEKGDPILIHAHIIKHIALLCLILKKKIKMEPIQVAV